MGGQDFTVFGRYLVIAIFRVGILYMKNMRYAVLHWFFVRYSALHLHLLESGISKIWVYRI